MCVLIFCACFWAAWPIAEMGFDDDWSYIKSAQVFAQTGQLIYNGWATAMLGWQIPWGALFIHLFGFSFTAVKLSTLPVAMFSLFLFHVIQIRFGITARNAVIGTLTLGLSPLLMPLAASYMTDVPGLLVVLVCLYCCQRAISAHESTTSIAWLFLAAVSNVVGGTVRQIAWLGVLIMLPSSAWLLRKRRGIFTASVILWLGSVATIVCLMKWFGRQPYSISDPLIQSLSLNVDFVLVTIFELAKVFAGLICLLLLIYPILGAWLSRFFDCRRLWISIFAFMLFAWTLAQGLLPSGLLWPTNLLFQEFTVAGANPTWDFNRYALPATIRFGISLLTLSALTACVATSQKQFRTIWTSVPSDSGRDIFWLSVPFVASYFALLVSRAYGGAIFDRYLLPIMPFSILCLEVLYQRSFAKSLPFISVINLALYALFAVAGTHDLFATQRASLKAIGELRASGVPRTSIWGSVEYNGWTQIEGGGHINDPRITNPSDAYKSDIGGQTIHSEGCDLDLGIHTPSVQPIYLVGFEPKACFKQSDFPAVRFHAWLPPFRRTIYIQQKRMAVN
jgi:hypothetical protein